MMITTLNFSQHNCFFALLLLQHWAQIRQIVGTIEGFRIVVRCADAAVGVPGFTDALPTVGE